MDRGILNLSEEEKKILDKKGNAFENGKGKFISLSDLYAVYDKWLYIKDKKRIDVGLAVALTREIKGTPIWIFFVGPSGDGKSEQVMALKDDDTEIMHEITAQTLVSGFMNKEDLAPQLDGKLVIFPDMAQLLNLHPNEKGKVWAQLRELYDGRAGKVTGCTDAKYDNLRVTLIGCSTPSIDSQVLVFTHLGTRELIYRTSEDNSDNLLNKVMENESAEEKMREELRSITNFFIESHSINNDTKISENATAKMKMMVKYLRFMRAHGDIDSFSGELRNFVYPEQPTRCLKQFKRILVALMSLDENYTEERALDVLSHITRSSILPLREKIFFALFNADDWTSTSKISEYARVGKKTALSQLFILWNMDMIDRKEETYSSGNTQIFEWKINEKGKELISWISSQGGEFAVTK